MRLTRRRGWLVVGAGRTYSTARPSRRRLTQSLSFGAVVVFHLLIFAVLTLEAQRTIAPPGPNSEAVSLMLGGPGARMPVKRDIAPAAAAPLSRPSTLSPPSTPSSPTLPSSLSVPAPVADVEPAPAPSASPPAVQPLLHEDAGAAASGPTENGSGGCTLEQQLRTRLAADPALVVRLEQTPLAARSVANAMQLWDGRWLTPAKLQPPELLDPVKTAIFQTVAAAKPSCLTEAMQGPRLIFVPAGGRTFIISLGSGAWRWADIAAP